MVGLNRANCAHMCTRVRRTKRQPSLLVVQKHPRVPLKGHYVVLEKKFKLGIFNTSNINEVIIQTQKYFSHTPAVL